MAHPRIDCRTGIVRVNHVHVFEPRLNKKSGKMEHSLLLLFPKIDPLSSYPVTEVLNQLKTQLPPVVLNNPRALRAIKTTFRDGDIEDELPSTVKLRDLPYAGHFFMSVSQDTARNPPVVIRNYLDPDGNQILLQPHEFKSGDYCMVSLSGYIWEFEGTYGISFGLRNIQFSHEGEALTRGNGDVRQQFDFGPAHVTNESPLG